MESRESDHRQPDSRFNSLLALANRLPLGTAENDVRRCVSAVIESDSHSRNDKVLCLIASIVQLEHQRHLGLRRVHKTGAMAIDRLLTALCHAAASGLPPFEAERLMPEGNRTNRGKPEPPATV